MTIDMTELNEMSRIRDKVMYHIGKADVTLLVVNSLASVQAIKALDKDEWKGAHTFTLDTWDMLTTEELKGLTKYYIVHVRGDIPSLPTALEFLARRTIVEKAGEFIVRRDQAGMSGVVL